MRYVLLSAAFVLAFACAEANAQIVIGPPAVAYYAPTVAVAAYPAPVTAYYGPAVYPVAQVAYYAPPAVYAAPTAVYYGAAPVVYGRPVWLGSNAYGGPRAYVAGQPVRNAFRFVTP